MFEIGLGESPMTLFGETYSARPRPPRASVGVGEQPPPVGMVGDGALGDGDTLGTNQSLNLGESITSPNGNVSLTMQQDGDLVLRTKDGTVLWRSGTAGRGAHNAWMDHDGNLRVTDAAGAALWTNGAHGHKDARARVEDTGNVYVWDGTHHMIWDAGATVGHPNPVPGGHGAAHTDFGGLDHDLNRLAHDLDHFAKDLIKDVKQFGPMLLSEVQGLISLIPGIGTGISAAIGLAMALLEGGSPLEIAIRTAYGAIPIPPGVRNVTDPIVDGAIHFANNPKDFTDAAITSVRDAVPAGIPREVFDTLIKIIVKHQPILKAAEGLVTDVAKQVPGVQNVIAAIPNTGQVFQSIKQVAPNIQVLPAQVQGLVQQAQAMAPSVSLGPAQASALIQHAQERVLPLHAYAAAQEMVHEAHQLGGPAAAAAVLAQAGAPPALGPSAPAPGPSAPPPPAPVAPPPAPPPPPPPPFAPIPPPPPAASVALVPYPPRAVALPYPPHPAPRPFVPGRVTGHSAMEAKAYPPYVRHGYPPHPGPRAHGLHGGPGTVGECAPDCKRWGAEVDMDHGMLQVANMLLTARKTDRAISTGPDGVTYEFRRTDAGITARPCLDR